MARRLDKRRAGFDAKFARLLADKREQAVDVDATVARIIEAVRKDGDAALLEFTQTFDRHALSARAMRVPVDEIASVAETVEPALRDALTFAAQRIERYHRRQKPADDRYIDEAGVELGHRWTAIDAVGLYVPGGLAAYPSSLLMNAVPAKVAGVKRVAMVTPTPDGKLNPLILAAARIAGVDEIYRVGGAQAIAALAYGTETIRPVDKIVGPGNAYVAAAKRRVFGQVGIDMIAGPSEILVVADHDNDADLIAVDLLSQAEHDESAQAILITDDERFADAVEAAVERQLQTIGRTEIASKSWADYGAIIVVQDLLAEAPALVDRLAPEHLELAVDDPDGLAKRVHHAGAIFLGRFTPEVIGDYVAGSNHVLPTARSARFASGLSVLDFMKRTSIVRCDPDSLAALAPAAITLAEAEGLPAHAAAVARRINRRD
jgi:histidinol dehydrogenase